MKIGEIMMKISGRELFLNYFNSLSNEEIAEIIQDTCHCAKFCPIEIWDNSANCEEDTLPHVDGCYKRTLNFLNSEFGAVKFA